MNILITGSAGFIGFHLVKKLSIFNNYKIFGIDNINNYYDVKLKKDRLKILSKIKNFQFSKIDITNQSRLNKYFSKNKFHIVINLAAQAGVRDSITDPNKYFKNNILGFYNIINLSRTYNIKHFLFASTSSVYGDSLDFPLSEISNTDKPKSFYAASKKTNETISFSFSNIYKMRITGLRFFTVYGPYGRPDMAYYSFTKSIVENRTIELYNKGNHFRDFTYIDDIVNSISKIMIKKENKKKLHNIFNIGFGKSINIIKLIKLIEKESKNKAKIKLVSIKLGDVKKTHSNISKLSKEIGYHPKTTLAQGMSKFYNWFKIYHKI